MIRIVRIFILSIVMAIGGCLSTGSREVLETKEEIHTVSDLAGQEIYIHEGKGYVPYIVVTDNYDGKALLLRKYVMSETRRMGDYHAFYAASEVDGYLNGEFYDSLPEETKNMIEDANIKIVDDGYSIKHKDIIAITRKVFLLSMTEVCKSANGVSYTWGKKKGIWHILKTAHR